MPFFFHYPDSKFKVPQAGKTKKFLEKISVQHKRRPKNVHYNFVDDETLLKMNIEFLNHKTLTDIITFDYSEGNTISGEIYISYERMMDNANTFHVTKEEELIRVLCHGIFHLCGYKDKTVGEAKQMRSLEEEALKEWMRIR
jgi:rRNA maturation RNase YbeY